jgi:hypothetical protein
MAQNAHAVERRTVIGLPVFEQVVEDWIEVLFGRIPRFEEIMMNARLINGLNGGVRVGVCSEQNAFRFRINVDGPADEIHAAHFRHALIGEKKSHGIMAAFQRFQRADRCGARIGSHDPVAVRVALAQVAFDGAEHFRIIVKR